MTCNYGRLDWTLILTKERICVHIKQWQQVFF